MKGSILIMLHLYDQKKSDLFLSALNWEAASSRWRPCHSCERWVDSIPPSRSLKWPKKKKKLVRCVSLYVAVKDPDMVWLCAVWSASTSSSWQLWTPSPVSSHTAYHHLHFTCSKAPKINSQLSLGKCINPHFSGGFYTQEICICTSSTGSFALLHKDFSVFSRRFFQGNFFLVLFFARWALVWETT